MTFMTIITVITVITVIAVITITTKPDCEHYYYYYYYSDCERAGMLHRIAPDVANYLLALAALTPNLVV